MIELALCNDTELILSTVTDVSVYPYVSSDESPKAEDYKLPAFGDNFFAVACFLNKLYVGCFLFNADGKSIEIHTCILAPGRKYSRFFGVAVINFIFERYSYQKITTYIQETNIKAKNLAIKCGFLYDFEDKYTIIGGNAVNLYRYAIKRTDTCH